MTRIRFENLPSTNTPRTAENLNKLNNVVISSTEPTTGEEVWLQKGKNLFKYSGISSQSTYICPCKAGDVFTLSFTGSTTSSDVRLFLRTYNGDFTTSLDSYVDNQVINLSSTSNNYSKTITSTTNGFVYIRTASSYINYTLNNIQLEKGSTATTYEAYIDKKIYTKNNNDVYEEFYEEVKSDAFKNDEVVVGSIRSKNMFGNYTIINGWIDNGIVRTYTSSTERIAFVDCKPNTTYTISKTPVSSRFRVGNYTTIPPMTATATDYTIGTIIKNDSGTKITYTTNATAKYLLIQYSQTNEDSADLIQQILNTMQVEEGSEATNFMPYQQIETVIENFANKVTFASGEEAAAGLFRKIGNQIIIMYQGPNKTHSGETLLFTLPEAYRPKSLIVAPYTKWANAYGQVIIYDNGQCKIGNISSTSATGRVAFNVTYTTD